MTHRPWLTVVLLAVIAVLLGLLVVVHSSSSALAQASEGQANKVIAIAAPFGNESLLYVIDTSREVILVYGFHHPGTTTSRNLRNGAFEFVAGRLYQWDSLLTSKHGEYSIRGVRTLGGLRPQGPGSSEEEYKRQGQ